MIFLCVEFHLPDHSELAAGVAPASVLSVSLREMVEDESVL